MLYTREIEPLERRVANDFLKINSGIEKAFFRNEGRSCDDSWRATHTIGVFQVDEGMKIGDLNEALHAVLKFAVRYPSAQKKAFELLKKCLQPFDNNTGWFHEKWVPTPEVTVKEFAVLNSLSPGAQREVLKEGISHIFDLVADADAVFMEVSSFDERGQRLCQDIRMTKVGDKKPGVHSRAADSSIWRMDAAPR